MSFLTTLLFESAVMLGLLCVAVCAVLLVLWRRTGSPGRRNALGIAVPASAVLLVAQALVRTDRERAIALMEDLAAAVQEPDFARIEQAIDADYRDGRDTRETLIRTIHERLTRYTIQRVGLSAFEFESAGDEAAIRFRVICDLRSGDNFVANMPSRWEVRLVRREGQWAVRAIRALQIGLIQTRGPAAGPGW